MKDTLIRVLIIEDSEDDVLLIIRELKKGGYDPVYERAETAASMKKALEDRHWDIILCDYKMPEFSAPAAIDLLKQANIDIPVIIISGAIGEETAVECMRMGARDYIMKDNLSRLCPAVTRELEDVKLRNKERQTELQRLAALEFLRKSEKYFKEITENSSDIIIITDKNGDIKYCSLSIERSTGYKPEELVGKSTLTIIHPDDKKRAAVDYGKAVLKTESAIPNSFRIVCKDGSERCFEGLGKNLLDNPDVEGFIMNVRDITDRKKAEEELRESEEKYRTILETMQESYYELDLAGNLTFVNNSVCRNTGYSKDELIGMNYRHYTDKEDLQRVLQAYSEVYLTGKPVGELSWRIIKKDGTKMYIEGSASLKKDSSGRPIGFKGIHHDITDRKKAEEELRKSDDKYRSILKNIKDGYFEVDLAGNLTFFNESMCEIYGYSREELTGINYRKYTDEESAKKVFKSFNEIYKTRTTGSIFEYEIIRKDGTKRQIEVSASLIKDSLDEPIGFRGISRDITERKQAEDARKESEQKYRLLFDEMISGYAVHEIICDQTGKPVNYRFLAVNGAFEKMTGLISADVIGRTVLDVLPGTEPIWIERYGRVALTREPDQFEQYSSELDKYYEVRAFSLEQGKFAAIINDITERKKAEDARKESEKKYRDLYDFLPIPVYEMDFESNIISANRAIYEKFGGTEETLKKGFKVWKILTPEALEKSNGNIQKLLKREQVSPTEYTLKKLDGSEFPAIVISSLSYMNDKPVGLRGAIIDITERKKAEEALRESVKKYRLLADNIDDVIFVLDIHLNYTYASPSVKTLLGYEPEELLNLRFSGTMTPSSFDAAMKRLSGIMERENSGHRDIDNPLMIQLEMKRKDGSTVWTEHRASFLRDENQHPVSIISVGRDITERKQMDEKLQQTLESLRKAIGATIQVLISALEARDPYTAGHQHRVADLARAIATEMGLPQDQVEGIRMAGSIHDIGKLSIPAEILVKPTKLTNLEFTLIKEHAQNGYEMLKNVESPWPLADIVHQHHERMNGSGYPGNLKGDEILMEARIMAVADVVEAMASHRPYRPALGIDVALEEIEKNRGILYDQAVAAACLRLFREKEYKLV